MTESRDFMFVFLIMLIALLIIISNLIDYNLVEGGEYFITPNNEKIKAEKSNILDGFYNTIDSIPVVNFISPLVKIMTARYSEELVPLWLTILIDGIFGMMGLYVIYSLIRRG